MRKRRDINVTLHKWDSCHWGQQHGRIRKKSYALHWEMEISILILDKTEKLRDWHSHGAVQRLHRQIWKLYFPQIIKIIVYKTSYALLWNISHSHSIHIWWYPVWSQGGTSSSTSDLGLVSIYWKLAVCIPSNLFCFKDVRISVALLPLAMQEMSTLEEKLIRIMRFTGISVTGFF